MPLIVTPTYLTHRAELYHQLASLTSAGVGLVSGLEMVRNAPPSRSFRAPLDAILKQLKTGNTFTEAVSSLGHEWIPAFDTALIEAGEKSGRLDICFRMLAGYYEQRARLSKDMISSLAYPAFLIHAMVLIFPISLLSKLVWEGSAGPWLVNKILVLVPLYAGITALVYAAQGRHSERWRSIVERILRSIPILGAARQNLAFARLSAALEGLLGAGVDVIHAWELAARSSGSPEIERTVHGWRRDLEAGQTPAEKVAESRIFPDVFVSMYATAENSGRIDETLGRLYRHFQEEGSRQMQAVAQWTPKLVYFGALIFGAFKVLSFYGGYFDTLNSVM